MTPSLARPPGDYVVQVSPEQPPEVARYTDCGTWSLIGEDLARDDGEIYRIGPMIEIDRGALSAWSLPG